MRHPPLQPGWIDRPHRSLALGDFALENGAVIEDFRLSYVVHGIDTDPAGAGPAGLAAEIGRRPVVLALSAIGSTHHRLDFLIGPGRALDPTRVVVLAVDAIGNGLTTSPSTSLQQPGLRFPRFSIRDMVRSQCALLDRLGVGRLAGVVGASMGGMQALQWAVSHGDRLGAVVALTPMAKTSPWAVAINETSRRALLADPVCLVRDPSPVSTEAPTVERADDHPDGWSAWVPLMQLLSGRTPEQVEQAFDSSAAVVDWIRERTRWWRTQRFAAVDWLYQSWAYDAHDVGTSPGFGGDTRRALASVRVPSLIMAPPVDLYNPPSAARFAADAIPGARFVEIRSCWGHQSASAADPAANGQIDRAVADFLADVVR